MDEKQWVWVYEDRAHGYFDSAEDALKASEDALHWTRHADVVIAYITADPHEAGTNPYE